MIRKLATLIRELQKAEVAQLDKAGIKHAPTIGEMYEGLTAKVVNQLIPAEANLRVVSGFATDGEGNLSGQIDCMLVSGSGTRLPHTRHFVWHIKDVIAVFEVKKRLFSTELQDAHEQLRRVLYLHRDYLQRQENGESTDDFEPSLYVFGQITGQVPPLPDEVRKLPLHLEMIYHSLIIEQIAPIRIVFSYSGYRSDISLRRGFAQFLEKNALKQGFGGASFPNLIVCGNNSLLKLNGHPYYVPLKNEDWLVFVSCTENPLILLLELIWTRLSYRLTMPRWFDMDLSMEKALPLLWGRAIRYNSKTVWAYRVQQFRRGRHSPKITQPAEWAPHIVSLYQFVLMNALCALGEVPVDSPYVKGNSTDQDKADLEDLFAKRLIARQGNNLVLLTRHCECMIMPEEGYVVADNSSGRLTAWANKKLAQIKK